MLSSTATTTVIIVGAVVGLVGGLVFLWFLYLIWKVHHEARYPKQPLYSPLPSPYVNSTASLVQQPTPPLANKKSGLSKWAKIITVISPVFAIAGVAVSIYFGLKQK